VNSQDQKKSQLVPNYTEDQMKIGFVVDRTNYIEHQINRIICLYLKIDKNKEDFFNEILLSNDVLGLGQKIKVFKSISEKEKWLGSKLINKKDLDDLQKIIGIRNKFAHNRTNRINININIDSSTNNATIVDTYKPLTSVSNSGKLEKKKQDEMLEKFIEITMNLEKSLNKIEKALS